MLRITRGLLLVFAVLAFSTPAHAQWPALYFRPDPFLRLDLSRQEAGTTFSMTVSNYRAESYFDGLDQTPHTSRAEIPSIRFERVEYVLSGLLGITERSAVVLAIPVSHVSQRLFETGDWGIEKFWMGAVHSFDRHRHFTLLLAAAMPVGDPVGNLHLPVAARRNSGLVTAQFVYNHAPRHRAPRFYLRAGAGMYTLREAYYGRRLYEFPGEFRASFPLAHFAEAGLGGEGRFVVGAPENHMFASVLTSHDAFAFGPDLRLRLTPQASLHATYRQDVFGFYATAGAYWNVAMVFDVSPH